MSWDGPRLRLGPEGSTLLAWGSVWAKEVGGARGSGLTEQGPWIYSDGDVAVWDQEITADAAASLMKQYPETDPAYVRGPAHQTVAVTAH